MRFGRFRARAAAPLGTGGGGDVAVTVTANAVVLVASLATGVTLAHALGPSGRGATAAIITAPIVIAWLFTLGSTQAVSYFQAKDPAGGRVLATWLALALPLGVLAALVGEALLPVFFSAQSAETLRIGRETMPLAIVLVLNEALAGVVVGDQRFVLFNVARAGSQTAIAIAYVALVVADDLTVRTAVAVFALVQVTVMVVLLIASAARHGMPRPSASLARTALWYGFKGHGVNVGAWANARLDLLIMPAFLPASSVGLYSVATNVSWIVVVLAGPLSLIALPLATRSETGGGEVVWRILRVTLLVAGVIAAAIALAAPWALRLVYGADFVDATTALRILLPGSVLFAAAFVLISGLFSNNRPFSATLAQATGALVTVVGLSIFLDSGGIDAAAIVSSVAYTVVFVTAVALYLRSLGQREAGPARDAGDFAPPLTAAEERVAANVTASEPTPREPGA
jgi:O-antigen/teichoic acid export membrane protein